LFFSALVLAFAMACKPEFKPSTEPVTLTFSSDTVYLDTVFSSVGSSTRQMRIVNPSNQAVLINNLYLAGGESSPFRINVNGESGHHFADIQLAAHDSIYVFVEVTAAANGISFLYTDSIVLLNAGLSQDIHLVTLALDAYFHYPNQLLVIPQNQPNQDIRIPYRVLNGQTTWPTDKPHIIYGYVLIDSASSLDILAGSQLHFHNQSGIWVSSGGQLRMDASNNGSYDNPITLEGDRLEPFYHNIPGQWGGVLGGLFVQRGANLIMNHTWLRNGSIGIRADSVPQGQGPNVTITNSRITDMSRAGIYSGFGNIHMENVVIGNSGLYGFYTLGGTVNADHCSFVNHFPSARNTATIGLFNRYDDGMGSYRYRDLNQANFSNCIITGSNSSEVGFGHGNQAAFNTHFEGSLIKLNTNPSPATYDPSDPNQFLNCLFNADPQLVDINQWDYALDSASQAIDLGIAPAAQRVPLDALNHSRVLSPDAGALER